ncbi:MAG: hypothetical protein HYX72_00570 [Acidobacteria bacterium]|nr:hypothetical protein [Acidobacteriota bacterium]
MAHPQIAVFARLANGGEAPSRIIAGQKTKLGRTMHDIRYDAVHDEIYVTNPFAQAVLAFRGAAGGEEAPVRIIQGPRTQLKTPDVLEIDTIHNEIFVPDTGSVHVFKLGAQGDVAPLRTLRYSGGLGQGGIAVDPIHNVMVNAAGIEVDGKQQAALLIFNRTDQGDAKPKAIITGPKTGLIGTRQLSMYPQGGYVVVSQITSGVDPEPQGTFVGIWSINDKGDVPPRWRIDGKPSNIMKKPRGVVINPKHKEIIVSDMRLNAVLTFYLPEMFTAEP